MNTIYGPQNLPEYVGLTEENAIKKANNEKFYICHISSKDGIEYPMSSSLCYGRISFDILNDIIIKATKG